MLSPAPALPSKTSRNLFDRLLTNPARALGKSSRSRLSLLVIMLMAVFAPGMAAADGHETVETLKASLASLEKKFAAVTKDRDGLYDQLLNTIEDLEKSEIKTKNTEIGRAHILEKFFQQKRQGEEREQELLAQIEQSENSRDYVSDRLQKVIADSKAQSANALASEQKMSAEADSLAAAALTQIQSALAERDAAEARAKSASNGRTLARNRLLAMNDQVGSLTNQVGFLRIQLAKAEGDLASKMANNSGQAGKQTKADESAGSAGVDAAWANNVSKTLAASYRSLGAVSVSELPGNRVSIRIGNAGLFETGASALSSQGQNLLSKLGQALRDQADARILILGHTDDIPVGNTSTYVDNTDLSNRRALSAMKYLGERVGITFSRMSSTGLAENYPIASNETAAGRAKNRRIELELTPLQ